MAETPRDPRIELLERALLEVTTRMGPYSIIAKTIEGALQSGTDDDLLAGEIAFKHFSKYYEQLTLEDSRKRVQADKERARKLEAIEQERARELEAIEQKKIEKAREQEARFKAIEKRESDRVKPRLQDVFGDWGLSDGTDFSRHDPLSAGKRRHLIAKARRRKKPSKPTRRPKRK